MKPKDLFRYGCTNLFRRKTRTALTALSMAVGVMCIVVLISVGLGYEQAYRESIEALGSLTKIDVTPATGDYGRKALLNDKALEAFRGIDGVEAVTPVYQQSAYIVSGNYVNMVRVYGIDMTTAERFRLTPERGVMAGTARACIRRCCLPTMWPPDLPTRRRTGSWRWMRTATPSSICWKCLSA